LSAGLINLITIVAMPFQLFGKAFYILKSLAPVIFLQSPGLEVKLPALTTHPAETKSGSIFTVYGYYSKIDTGLFFTTLNGVNEI